MIRKHQWIHEQPRWWWLLTQSRIVFACRIKFLSFMARKLREESEEIKDKADGLGMGKCLLIRRSVQPASEHQSNSVRKQLDCSSAKRWPLFPSNIFSSLLAFFWPWSPIAAGQFAPNPCRSKANSSAVRRRLEMFESSCSTRTAVGKVDWLSFG